MSDIKLTTGSNFEGYEIEEYLGIVNGQIALSSNFLKDLSSNIAEWTADESTIFTGKLQSSSRNAIQNLVKIAKKKGANAIIGVQINYTGFSINTIGTVATGTAVRIRRKKKIKKTLSTKLHVTNYYNMLMPRPVNVSLIDVDNSVMLSPVFYNYIEDEVKAIRCDIELTNHYEEKLLLQNIDFVFERSGKGELRGEPVDCKLPVRTIPLIKDVKVFVKTYVTNKGIFAPNSEPVDITYTQKALTKMKERHGIDAVERYKSDGVSWICNCGYINASEEGVCPICGRIEEEIKYKVDFDYEEMCNEMSGLTTVAAMKDVLLDHIKKGEIDAKYRMELLQIMESGLQYEKTKGSMVDTVLDKVIKVFEG